jgi:hypothetical protein
MPWWLHVPPANKLMPMVNKYKITPLFGLMQSYLISTIDLGLFLNITNAEYADVKTYCLSLL